MQTVSPQPAPLLNGRTLHNLRYLLTLPIATFVTAVLLFAVIVGQYRGQHNGRIYTGVSVMGIDLSRLTPQDAQAALTTAVPYPQEPAVTLTYGDQSWQKTPAELGLSFDEKATIEAAMAIGRDGTPTTRLQEMFQSWYYGRSVAPVWQLNEGQLADGLADVAAQLDRPAISAALNWNGETADYTPGQVGHTIDLAEPRPRGG